MSRRKKAGRAESRDSKPSEVTPDWKAEMPPADPPRPHKSLLILSGALLGIWMIVLAVIALTV
jgi:hypothetical protein